MNRYNNYHKHSHVSSLILPDSNTKQEEYIKKCVEYGHTNYFTTEHGSFGDIFEARTLCNKYGIRCIAGIEGYIVPNPLEKDKRNYHIVVIPKTDVARKKMNYVSSHANIEGYYYRPRFFIQDLLDLDPNDIYITTACVQGLLKDKDSYNLIFKPLYKHFGSNILLEVQNHDVQIQKDINIRALKLSDKLGLKLIAANDSHYIEPNERFERLELLKGKGITYDEEDEFILDFPTSEEMFERFKRQGILSENQIEESINNTLIFDECEEIQLDDSIKMPTIYPELTPAQRIDKLKEIVNKKFKQIVKDEHISKEDFQKYKEGILYEMKIIEDTNEAVHSADYFLFNTKNVELATQKYGGVLTRGGRGSCASFYINKILGMTQLDRFKINLPIFPDRFLSVARAVSNRSLADIDYNVKEQEPFVKASRELLGEHGCYPMVSYGLMQQSEAFRNVCRSHKLEYDKYNEVAKNIERYLDDSEWKPYIEEAQKYIGTIISASVHPCAHILSDKNLLYEYGVSRIGEHLCVLITSNEADEYKVLKNDYLIVTVWNLIDETFKLIGKPIISAHELLENIKNNERIWNLFRDGITCTLNQVDSTNGTKQAQRYGIKSFEDGCLIAAAIRPSFDSWRDKFLNHEDYSTGSKDLDEVLSMTHHYILFQENLMQYFDWLGISPSTSINLIKRISKKKIKQEDFDNLEITLKENWIKQTGSIDMFKETWEMIQSCIAYGFCTAHAAATSLDMCYGAYLKVNYPLEYYTVCFNVYNSNEEKTRKLTNELKYFNLTLSDIKFAKSQASYSCDKTTNTIYKGIASIKFLNDKIADELFELGQNEYSSFINLLEDIKEKTSVNSRQLDILIKLDFFSQFGEINQLLKQVEIFDLIYNRKQFRVEKIKKLSLPMKSFERCADSITEKTIKIFDSIELIKDICSTLNYPKTTIIQKISYQQEFLGYIQTTIPNIKPSYAFVQKIDGQQTRRVSLYRLNDGSIEILKVRKKAFSNNPFNENDIIKTIDCYEEKKWKYDKENESYYQIDEKEMILSKWSIVEDD